MSQSLAPVLQAVCLTATLAPAAVENAVTPTAPMIAIGLVAVLALAALSLMPLSTLLGSPALAGEPRARQGDLSGVRLLI